MEAKYYFVALKAFHPGCNKPALMELALVEHAKNSFAAPPDCIDPMCCREQEQAQGNLPQIQVFHRTAQYLASVYCVRSNTPQGQKRKKQNLQSSRMLYRNNL
jgi:hypothetical protein